MTIHVVVLANSSRHDHREGSGVVALTFEAARDVGLAILAGAVVAAIVLAWLVKTIVAKLLTLAVLAAVAVAAGRSASRSQDCADRVGATLSAGAVDDTTCTFFGVRSRWRRRSTDELDDRGGHGVGMGVRAEVAGALDLDDRAVGQHVAEVRRRGAVVGGAERPVDRHAGTRDRRRAPTAACDCRSASSPIIAAPSVRRALPGGRRAGAATARRRSAGA